MGTRIQTLLRHVRDLFFRQLCFMNSIPPQLPTSNPAVGLLGRFGLATMIGFAMLFPLGLTVLYPPWNKVDCQRRQILYWSEQTEVHSSSFAGFDFLFSNEKWHREQTPPTPASDTYFKSIEYQLAYPILVFEWFLLAIIGIIVYWRSSRHIFSPLLTNSNSPAAPPPQSPQQ